MNKARLTRFGAAGVGLMLAGTLGGQGLPASAQTRQAHKMTTIKFLDTFLDSHNIGRVDAVFAGKDTRGRKVVGYSTARAHAHNDVVTGEVVYARKNGLIFTRFSDRNPNDHTQRGRITGGTGSYAGIHGRFVVRDTSDDDAAKVVLKFRK